MSFGLKEILSLCVGVITVSTTTNLLAWDGFDYDADENIEIEEDNLVRRGKDIEVYHYDDGSYHQEEVQGIYHDVIEAYDYEIGEFRYYEMD